jgi:antitoxin ParD1/3/4
MNISLTSELEQWIQKKVASGRYQTSSEVVREALRAQIEREEKLELLRGEIEKGWADAEAGRTVSLAELDRRLAKR